MINYTEAELKKALLNMNPNAFIVSSWDDPFNYDNPDDPFYGLPIGDSTEITKHYFHDTSPQETKH